MTLRAVLFDLDDTLNDRSASWLEFVHRIEGRLSRGVTADVHRDILAADQRGYGPKQALFRELARLPWKSPMSTHEVERLWRDQFPACTVTRPGVEATLARLRRHGIRTGIVSNGRDDGQRSKLRAMGLLDAVDVVVTSGQLGIRKPDPRIYETALTRLDTPANAALFVGDDPHRDILGSARLGMKTAWMANGRSWPITDTVPDFTLERFEKIDVVLHSLHDRSV